MSDETPIDVDALIDEAARGWSTPPPPSSFVDAVMAARAAELGDGEHPEVATAGRGAAGRRGRVLALLRHPVALPLVAAAAAVLVLAVERAPALLPPSSGSAEVATRTTLDVAGRAIAVAEGGARLTWGSDPDGRFGALRVEQTHGSVFYRVAEGGSFVVATPAGQVMVTGTCFQIEVFEMNAIATLPKSHVLSAALGAVVGAAVMVTVYEGSVSLTSGGETMSLAAGEQAALEAGEAPARLPGLADVERAKADALKERDLLRTELDELEQQLKTFMIAEANGQDPLVAENRALKDELRKLREELSVEEQIRTEQEGKPFEFPEDLPERYRQEAMKKAVMDALKISGLEGDIHSIDCGEFPCMVQGETLAPGNTDDTSAVIDDGYRKMQAFVRDQYPEDQNSYSNSSWGDVRKEVDGKEYRLRRFSVAIYPKDAVPEDQRKDFHRRIRWRNDQLREAWPLEP